jgi:hypothetical protein
MNIILRVKGDKDITSWERDISFTINGEHEFDGTLFWSDQDGFDYDINDLDLFRDLLVKEGKDESTFALDLLDMEEEN